MNRAVSGKLEETTFEGPLADRLRKRPDGDLCLYWLGQAGFVIDLAGYRLVIDPYLSDTLAAKYRGTAQPHIRMMPPPVLPEECLFVDLVLCTHAHTDHMDPGTLKLLFAANPAARLVAPRAARQQALDRSCIEPDRLIQTNAGETLSPLPGLSISSTPAAHETLETDAEGHHRFLGYVLDGGPVRLWHSGDCVPFPGLEPEIAGHRPDIVLLPVNGRRPELSDNGVPGNFTLQEAIAVAQNAGATDMVAHHYGLFEFNTERPEVIDAAAASMKDIRIHRARTGTVLTWHAQ